MAIGDEQPDIIEIVDWHKLYSRQDDDEAIIPGIAFRGRWTAIAAAAKAGKSTVLLGLAVSVARANVTVLYLDAEMGRGDILDRVEDWMQLKPEDLANLHYSDLPPHIDTVQGAAKLGHTINAINPDLVIIDGLNGVAAGAENEDTTWRDLFDLAIAPMKQQGIAIVSADNLGKDKTLGPRGSSVKLDKADAIIALERTENGCKLTATHRRTAAYPHEQTLIVAYASEDGPPMQVRRVEGDYPEGTKEVAAKLDRVDAPLECGRRTARRLLQEAGETGGKNETLAAALKYRRETALQGVVPHPRDHPDKTPGQRGDQNGVSMNDTPPFGGPVDTDGNPTLSVTFEEDPFQ